MSHVSRFQCASSPLRLKALLRTRRAFSVSLLLGVAAHLSLTQLAGSQDAQKAAKPLTTQFVKRQPRLTKPLELKKRPQPKRRPVERRMVSVKARMLRGQRGPRFQATARLRGLARPSVSIGRMGTSAGVGVEPTTLADSISVGVPRDRIKALRAVREAGGEFVVVSDEEILEAMRVLGQTAGVFAEPAGAASLAGLHRMLRENRVDPEERIVVLVTGNGLKDVNSAIRAVEAPKRIEPTVDDLRRLVDRLGIEAVTD